MQEAKMHAVSGSMTFPNWEFCENKGSWDGKEKGKRKVGVGLGYSDLITRCGLRNCFLIHIVIF